MPYESASSVERRVGSGGLATRRQPGDVRLEAGKLGHCIGAVLRQIDEQMDELVVRPIERIADLIGLFGAPVRKRRARAARCRRSVRVLLCSVPRSLVAWSHPVSGAGGKQPSSDDETRAPKDSRHPIIASERILSPSADVYHDTNAEAGGRLNAASSEWMTVLRPRLHRYCARMMGSTFDGEDIVQETMAKATNALSAGATIAEPERWLFRIAHNAALDALRRRQREGIAADASELAALADPAAADARVSVAATLSVFLDLVPMQRASVALVDVIGYSLKETAATLDTSVAAVKAALHRGRHRLRETVRSAPAKVLSDADRERLGDYAERFNAHDWDALRGLLAEDVRLDLVNRVHLVGRRDVGLLHPLRGGERLGLCPRVGGRPTGFTGVRSRRRPATADLRRADRLAADARRCHSRFPVRRLHHGRSGSSMIATRRCPKPSGAGAEIGTRTVPNEPVDFADRVL